MNAHSSGLAPGLGSGRQLDKFRSKYEFPIQHSTNNQARTISLE